MTTSVQEARELGRAAEVMSMSRAKEEARKAPWEFFAFVAVVLGILFLIARDQGWIAPSPPIRLTAVEMHTDGVYVYFQVSGVKTRNDRLISETATWVFGDGAIQPEEIYRPDGQVVGEVDAAVVQGGTRFSGPEMRVEVPSVAFSDASSTLRLCFNFAAYGTYCPVNALFSEIPRRVIGAPQESGETPSLREPPSISPLG